MIFDRVLVRFLEILNPRKRKLIETDWVSCEKARERTRTYLHIVKVTARFIKSFLSDCNFIVK
jgi:hypothetical protein